jgi:hypothetical protein
LLSFREFTAQIAHILRLPTEPVLPDSDLEGLGFDSLDHFLLLTTVEDLADAPPGAADGVVVHTLSQAYSAYRELSEPAEMTDIDDRPSSSTTDTVPGQR